MKYMLISVTRNKLEINTSMYDTFEAAHKAMIEDILLSTEYDSLEEIIDAADAGKCGFVCGYYEDYAWAETNQSGLGHWKIVEC